MAESARQRNLLATLVFVIVVAHILYPSRVQIDWPTIALVGIFILLVFAPKLSWIIPFVKRIKLGEAEVEMQESLQRLHQDVKKAEGAIGIADHEPGGTEEKILELASRDKESAIVRIAIEIEKGLETLFRSASPGTDPPKTIRELVRELELKGVLSPPVAKAIIEFRDVRNRVIHPRVGQVHAYVLSSALDSGIRILRLLRYMVSK
jgi:uncharacterized protein YutE (UPF0331/DUF86 family)